MLCILYSWPQRDVNDYLIVKWVHMLSSTFLFGTGVGSAFYMLFTVAVGSSSRRRGVAPVVIADWLFTATTVVVQPVTGL